MSNQDIINYIKSTLASGVSRQEITDSLVKAGWQVKDIEDSFNTIYAPTASSEASFLERVTEERYPITTIWVFKTPIIIVVVSIVGLLFGIWFPYLVIAFPIFLVLNPLTRSNFHYATEEKFFVVKEGIISKKQRNLPYGVIQNVFVKQDIFDRIFGIASLAVENAVQGDGKSSGGFWSLKMTAYKNQQGDKIGSSGNQVSIPGLKKEDAEALKNILLQRMKENPNTDIQSGL